MSSKSWSCQVEEKHEKKSKIYYKSNGRPSTELLLSPQPASLVTESPSGVSSRICVQVTVSLCACGAAIGFCLLVAGGIDRNHHGNIKVLMYIGILTFLVSVTLLVILCSSFGIFNMYPTVTNPPEELHCTCPADPFKPVPASHIVYSYPMKGDPKQAIAHYCHLHDSPLSAPKKHYDVISLNKNELPRCTVKNCVCLLKNLDMEQSRTNESNKEFLQMPFQFNSSLNGCSFCYYGSPHFASPNTHYCKTGIEPCIHNSVSPYRLNTPKVVHTPKQEISLRDKRPRQKGSSSRERKRQESKL